MENTPLSNYRNLANHLAKIMNDNQIIPAHSRDSFIQLLAEYVREESLKGMEECIKIFHKLYGHQESYLVLSCKFRHCIECYYYFTQEYFDTKKLYCTCSTKIVPKYKALIWNNYERIQSLRMTCSMCYTVKDKMNFPAINTHRTCIICYSCISTNYVYEKHKKNTCIGCGNIYDDESELLIRNIYEEKLDESVKKAFYLEECKGCNSIKDSRDFVMICAQHHLACAECVNLMNQKKDESGWCGDQISIIK